MAKVTGPLFSISASGKISNAMVYFPWKGLHVVRQWLKPTNPQSGAQGNRRVMLGGLGRAPKFIQKDSVYHTHALGVAVPPDTWISTFVKYIMTTYFTSADAFAAHWVEVQNHGAFTDWKAKAVTLGLTAYNLEYKSMLPDFAHSHQLYCLAKYACDQYLLNNAKFNTVPYTKALDTPWDGDDIQLMIDDFTP